MFSVRKLEPGALYFTEVPTRSGRFVFALRARKTGCRIHMDGRFESARSIPKESYSKALTFRWQCTKCGALLTKFSVAHSKD